MPFHQGSQREIAEECMKLLEIFPYVVQQFELLHDIGGDLYGARGGDWMSRGQHQGGEIFGRFNWG